MSDYRLVPVESIKRAMYALERFANDTLAGRNSAHELRELLAAEPAVQREHCDQAPDWSKAPEGATHWVPETDIHCAAWYREKDGEWEFWLHPDDCSWDAAGLVSDRIMIPRPDPDWIPTGGKKPELPDDTLVDVKFLGGHIVVRNSVDTWKWTQEGESYDITHYRVHQLVEHQLTISDEIPTRTSFGGPQKFTVAEQKT